MFQFPDSFVLARAVEADLADGGGAPLPRAARPPRPRQRQRRRGRRQRNARFGYSSSLALGCVNSFNHIGNGISSELEASGLFLK